MKGFVIGGTASGTGKTVATLAVVRALADAGFAVRTGKAGPDFIDPSHHRAVTGHPSRTLDTWMQGVDGVRRNFHRDDDGGEVRVVEGMMGLYDGSVTSTAATAEALDLPVVLVVDGSAGMESVGATALGFREYAAHAGVDATVAGVIAQRTHGGRHEAGIRDALPDGLAYLGRVPPDDALEIPDRHLGLHMGREAPVPASALSEAAEHLRTDQLADLAREAARPADEGAVENASGDGSTAVDARPTVAVADDAAFAFTYPASLEALATSATIRTFSPVAGDPLPDCDAVYLPGGYPERHPEALSEAAASGSLATLADRATEGLPILGECGGLMALAETLTTADGETCEMAGVLPADVRMHDRYQALDHVQLTATRDAPTASAGESLCGHEFHYSSLEPGPDARYAFDMERGEGIDGAHDGLTEYRTVGTYSHVHAASGAFDRLIGAAASYATGP